MIGGSTLGYSRTGSDVNPIMPNITITSDITMAKTGRFILVEAKLMTIKINISRSYYKDEDEDKDAKVR
jgi:hypothetical protein